MSQVKDSDSAGDYAGTGGFETRHYVNFACWKGLTGLA